MSCFCGHVEGLEGYEVFRGSKQPEDSSYVYIYIYIHTHIMFVYTCELLVHKICIQCISAHPIC